MTPVCLRGAISRHRATFSDPIFRRDIEGDQSNHVVLLGASVKDEVGELERRRSEIEAKLAAAPAPKLRLHPNLAELYRCKVAALADALNAETMRSEATAAMRGLIEEIRLVPADGKLGIELFGELAALIALASGDGSRIKHPRASAAAGVQVTLVAGRGFEPLTFRL